MLHVDIRIKRFLVDERGMTTIEYALAGALVVAALLASFTILGSSIAARVSTMADVIS